MRYTNYIWDFDGTIFDSYPHTAAVFWQVLGEEGLRGDMTEDDVMTHLLVTFGHARKVTGISDDAYARFLEITHRVGDAETLPHVVPFADCEAVLRAVVDAGGRNYLYTHRNKTALWYLDHFGYRKYFTDFILEEDGFPLKPAPDALLALMDKHGLDKADCIMVGDRELDGMAGKNAGMAGALVNYPPRLPDGTCPADVTELDYTATSLTEFAGIMGIL